MMLKRLSPGMEHGEETDLGALMFRVSGDLLQGLGSCPKEQVIDDSLVLQRQKTELFRQSEDNMEIAHWQEFLSTRLHPLGSGCSLAFVGNKSRGLVVERSAELEM